MQIENLNETDVTRLTEVVEELRKSNPAISYGTFIMGQDPRQAPSPTQLQLSQIQSDLDQLRAKIDQIFGGYVLIDGKWVLIK